MNPRTQIITDLRREILEKLDTYIYLSTPQCYQVIPKRGEGRQETWERALRRALQLTEDAGFITHGPTYEEKKNKRSGFATRKWVYFLTREGAEALAELRSEITAGGIKVSPVPHYQRKPASLAHETAITEFHIALAEALSKTKCKLHWIQKDTRKGTNPDAIFGIEDTTRARDKSTHWFFLEMELSRPGNWKEGESQKVRKLKHYDTYRRGGELRKDWPFIGDFRVIFHEETNERMTNLLKKLAGILPYRFIWITSKELIQERGILEKVFFTPRNYKERANSILDLTQ